MPALRVAPLRSNDTAILRRWILGQENGCGAGPNARTLSCDAIVWVMTAAEVLGDLLSFKWGTAEKALFSLKKREVALLEGELTSPGNEIPYIVKARETFS